MNEAWIWQYIFLERSGSHYVDIMLGGWLLNDYAWLKRGGVKNLGKSDYCETG